MHYYYFETLEETKYFSMQVKKDNTTTTDSKQTQAKVIVVNHLQITILQTMILFCKKQTNKQKKPCNKRRICDFHPPASCWASRSGRTPGFLQIRQSADRAQCSESTCWPTPGWPVGEQRQQVVRLAVQTLLPPSPLLPPWPRHSTSNCSRRGGRRLAWQQPPLLCGRLSEWMSGLCKCARTHTHTNYLLPSLICFHHETQPDVNNNVAIRNPALLLLKESAVQHWSSITV